MTATQDEHETPVIFRADRLKEFTVTAVFPTIPADYKGRYMVCYAHVGQHSSCSFDWYVKTRAATPEEYTPLLEELVAIGYRPKVCRRIIQQHRHQLFAALDASQAAR